MGGFNGERIVERMTEEVVWVIEEEEREDEDDEDVDSFALITSQ